jgi:hypothetical protein
MWARRYITDESGFVTSIVSLQNKMLLGTLKYYILINKKRR